MESETIQVISHDEIERYLGLYQAIKERVGDSNAAIAIFQVYQKDKRSNRINGNGNGHAKPFSNGNGDDKATPSQLAYLKHLGVEVKSGLSKAEASKLIDQTLEEQGGNPSSFSSSFSSTPLDAVDGWIWRGGYGGVF